MLATLVVATPVRSQSGSDFVDACRDAGSSESVCLGAKHLLETVARACRTAGGGDLCDVVDGRQINEFLMAAHERSWLARALELQRSLDDSEPLHEEFWLHTHNSFATEADNPPWLSWVDPNQTYSLRDQLRMGVRAIELDMHWVPHPLGDPANDFHDVVLCHGTAFPIAGPLNFHLGCTVDRLIEEGLTEIRAWMDEHPDEVVTIFVQNEMDGVPAAHEKATAELVEAFDGLVYRPSKACADLPVDVSRNEIRASGARVLLIGNCGPGAWGTLVHQRGERWDESGQDYGDDYPAYPCADERAAHGYGPNLIRRYGAETGFELALGEGGDVSERDAFNMARCGVNWIGLDFARPFDPRIFATIWSWAPDQPSTGFCAFHGSDGRFYSDDCLAERPFVCTLDGDWLVTEVRGAWQQGPQACADAAFAAPKNGYDNERLKEVKSAGEAWLNYSKLPDAGWRPDTA